MSQPNDSSAGGAGAQPTETPLPASDPGQSGAGADLSRAAADGALAIAQTRAWIERVVIGLNLCPFAKAPWQRGRVRIVHVPGSEAEALLGSFVEEARRLLATPAAELETTLLVHPQVLTDFEDYNDFLDIADAALEALGCTGVLQVASFHPAYRFEGTAADDITNATNRSPWPTLQLLREASVDAAITSFPESAEIYEANMSTLRALGADGWADLQSRSRIDAERQAGTAGASDVGGAHDS
jgi:hypothetical protein